MTHPALSIAALLHAGGAPGAWGNLGLWAADALGAGADDYATAAAALADAVARAAGLRSGHTVASLACGAGEELLRWRQHFGAGEVLGVEAEAALVSVAKERIAASGTTGIEAIAAADVQHALLSRPARFDVVLVVDAAYHLGPRRALFDAAAVALKPGGRFAYTDLVLDPAPETRPMRHSGDRFLPPMRRTVARRFGGAALRAAAALTGVPLAQLGHQASVAPALAAAGFDEVQIEHLDEPVLGGFVRFVQVQRSHLGPRARGPAWRRVALTAALIPPCRAAGLGYALISARLRPRG